MRGKAQQLIINADDFGYSKEINYGILEGHYAGAITSTTVMTNERYFNHAINLYPKSLGIGVHLNLTWGNSLSTGKPFSRWNKQKIVLGLIDPNFVEKEYRKQIEKLLARGIKPDHLDSHHYLHAFSPVQEIMIQLAKEYNINKIRWPKEKCIATAFSMSYLKQKLIHAQLKTCPLRTTDHFFGIRYAGNPRLKHFLSYLNFTGTAEICCHPGKASSDKRDRLAHTREKELAILTSRQFLDEIEKRKIKRISFKDL